MDILRQVSREYKEMHEKIVGSFTFILCIFHTHMHAAVIQKMLQKS